MRLKKAVEYSENIRRLTVRQLGEWLIAVADEQESRGGGKASIYVGYDGEITVTVRDR